MLITEEIALVLGQDTVNGLKNDLDEFETWLQFTKGFPAKTAGYFRLYIDIMHRENKVSKINQTDFFLRVAEAMERFFYY